MIAWAMRSLRRNAQAAAQPDVYAKYERQNKERDAWEEMRELELRNKPKMTTITLQLGSKVFIDGDGYTVVSASEVLDGDIGYGPITRKKILKLRSVSSGFEQTISTEVEE